jgi:polysaccharide export outer membrane protein
MKSARIQSVTGPVRSRRVGRLASPGHWHGGLIAAAVLLSVAVATAEPQSAPAGGRGPAAASETANAIVPPPGYVIGAEDVLAVLFWREKELSGDVAVRPDGKITLPLINDIQAAGLTPDELRDRVNKMASQFVEDPNATVLVRAINSRKVFITGQVAKPGAYPLGGPTTVLQLIAMAGGVAEYADSENIAIMRTENGRPQALRFNYKDVSKRKNLAQNIELKPGDTIVVP